VGDVVVGVPVGACRPEVVQAASSAASMIAAARRCRGVRRGCRQ
jgi:hypothetical protein